MFPQMMNEILYFYFLKLFLIIVLYFFAFITAPDPSVIDFQY